MATSGEGAPQKRKTLFSPTICMLQKIVACFLMEEYLSIMQNT